MCEKCGKQGAPNKQRVPMSELDPNAMPRCDHLHPELGPMLSLTEAQARPDIKRRGHQRTYMGPMLSLEEAQARPDIRRRGFWSTEKQHVQKIVESAQRGFSVPMPKRKPVPNRKESNVEAGVEPEAYRLGQIKRKPVPSKLPPKAAESHQERGSPIDSLWDHPSPPIQYQRRSYCQVTPSPSPGKVWRWLQVESEGAIEAWPTSKSAPASEASVGKVWRYLEAETDGVIEAWRRDPGDV